MPSDRPSAPVSTMAYSGAAITLRHEGHRLRGRGGRRGVRGLEVDVARLAILPLTLVGTLLPCLASAEERQWSESWWPFAGFVGALALLVVFGWAMLHL